MIRLDGNSILICDTDKVYGRELMRFLNDHGAICFFAENIPDSKALMQKYDFDIIICNYYLNDGIIFHLIDWCSTNLAVLPLFTCIGHPLPGDLDLSRKQSIVDIFVKTDFDGILKGLSLLLFDFEKFHQDLIEMILPTEILIEIQSGAHTYHVQPIELSNTSLLFQLEAEVPKGSFGILRFSLSDDLKIQNFIIPGFFENQFSGSYVFKINKMYLPIWQRFINFLSNRQVNITSFLKKASGF